MSIRIVVRLSKNKVYLYKNGNLEFTAFAAHGGSATTKGTRKITAWKWGAVSLRYEPNTWWSFGATFKGWPAPGNEAMITPHAGGPKVKVRRVTANTGDVWYDGRWYPIWKDINPFGVVMADLTPGTIELHGTGKNSAGSDVFPSVTHGCVRTHNKDILKIKSLAPVGTEVEIRD